MSIESSLPLRIVPLGGLSEIGMNCMVLEYADEMLVIDCGLMFSELDHFGVQFIIPDFKYIIERKDKLRGFILTHGHEDHIGALVFAIKAGLNAPIYASPFTALLLTQKLREHGLESSVDLITFEPGQRIEFEYFKVQTTSVNHSIVDASALIIETPLGAIVHTGDFKIDSTPFYGRKIDEGIFKKYGDQGVLVLLSDSTNVERCTHTQSESVIYAKFEQLFAAAEGLTVIAMFASNVARMGQIFELAKKLGKRVAVSGRTMEQNVRLGMDTGYLKDALSVIIPLQDIDSVERKNVILVSSGSQAELGSSLLRVSKGDHKQVQVKSGDVVVMSSRYIPGNEKPIGKMINQLFMQGAHVLYEAIEDIHVSGHASKPELKTMLEWVRPKYFIPIHGEYRHLVHHAKLAKESGVREENAIVAVNGDVIEITPDQISVVEKFGEQQVMLNGHQGAEITKSVLKSRRLLGETGVVFALLACENETRRVIGGPDIITRGIANESMEAFLIEEAKKVVQGVLKDWQIQNFDLRETIRIELRRFFNSNVGKKPVVVPIIIQV